MAAARVEEMAYYVDGVCELMFREELVEVDLRVICGQEEHSRCEELVFSIIHLPFRE